MLSSRGDGGSSRLGHSSVELLFAGLMVAVTAAILAPKVFRNSQAQRETRTRESLTVIRDAIALYHDQNMQYPPGETFAIEIAPYSQSPLPIPECLGPARTNAVLVKTENWMIELAVPIPSMVGCTTLRVVCFGSIPNWSTTGIGEI